MPTSPLNLLRRRRTSPPISRRLGNRCSISRASFFSCCSTRFSSPRSSRSSRSGPARSRPLAKDKSAAIPRLALHVVNHLDGYLSANQLGITIASLALGFLGEPFVESAGRIRCWHPPACRELVDLLDLADPGLSRRSPSCMWSSASWCPSPSPSASRGPVTTGAGRPAARCSTSGFHWVIVVLQRHRQLAAQDPLPHRPGQRERAQPLRRGTRPARHPERKIPGSHRNRTRNPHQRPRPQRTLGARRDDARATRWSSSMPTNRSKKPWKSRCAASTPASRSSKATSTTPSA